MKKSIEFLLEMKARTIEGMMLFAPGHGDCGFCKQLKPAWEILGKIYPSLIANGHITTMVAVIVLLRNCRHKH